MDSPSSARTSGADPWTTRHAAAVRPAGPIRSVAVVPWAPGARMRMDPRNTCPGVSRHADPHEPDVIALWYCPVCEAPVHRRRRPGRQRVYCTNACRQRAYRRRCAEGRHVPVGRRPDRAAGRDLTHARRAESDPMSSLRDSRGRGLTACGAFARVARDRADRTPHTRFYASSEIHSSCRSCEHLLDVRPTTLAAALDEIAVDHRRFRERRGTAATPPQP